MAASDVRSQVSKGTEKLAFLLLSGLASKKPENNILISPTSVAIALTFAYNGAGGTTADEMADLLGIQDVPLKEIDAAIEDLRQAFQTLDPKVELCSANALWVRKGVNLNSTFVKNGKTFFKASAETLDFLDPKSPATINHWVSDETKGKIKSIIDTLDKSGVLVLTNAVYFKATWTKPFPAEATVKNGQFKLLSGKLLKIPMMCDIGQFQYAQEAGLQILRLPYGNGHVAMYVLLPGVNDDFAKFVSTLTSSKFQALIDKLSYKRGTIRMPKFSIGYSADLSRSLISLGMKSAFDPERADFSGMADLNMPLFIGQILHKAVMNVNESGTEAAAATAIAMMGCSFNPEKPFTMNIDHPFVIVIHDSTTGEILFLGTVVKPDKFEALN
jgi:serpin B